MPYPNEILEAARILREGGLVAFPTETVYGLGADAFNARAVARIFEAKNRPSFDPLIVHVEDLSQALKITAGIPAKARDLAARFWPGPLTLVLPKDPKIPDIVTSGLPSVAVRVPAHPMALELLRETGRPLAAPSANPFGQVSPTTAEHVRQGLGSAVDLILDGGPCTVGVESTILSFLQEEPVLLRLGGLALEVIEALIGRIGRDLHPSGLPQAPGQTSVHYATKTPLYVLGGGVPPPPGGRKGFLGLKMPEDPSEYERLEILSADGDLREAASHLFAAMRKLDRAGLSAIVAERVPDIGLGRAINDRLMKAGQNPGSKEP